jgi:FkbM family methyltransferase
MPSRHRVLSVAFLLLAAGLQAGAEQAAPPGPSAGVERARPTAAVPFPALTPEEERAYGNRAEFFRRLPAGVRPDLDWRTAVSASLADAEPLWSQGFEELIIRDFFGERERGFYVDVGCYLPRQGSTTYLLEQRSRWTGVGIDVIAGYGKAWKRVRPESTFVAAAVSDRDGEKLQLHVAGAFATLDEETVAALGWAGKARVVEVETSRLDTLLERQGVEKIDFLSMDIEGAELAALKGFDIKRFRPDLCCIETAQRDAVVAYFESNGYELIEKYRKADKINLYFRPKPTE